MIMRMRQSKAKQSATDRLRRLQDRRCPIHGMNMLSDNGPCEQDGIRFWVVHCLRRDCSLKMISYDEFGAGPWDLPPQFSHLLAPYANPNQWVRILPSERNQQ